MNKRVLVIEDNKTIQLFAKSKIEKELHFEVSVAETKSEALELLERDDFFIILADLTLPDANGTEVIDAITPYGLPVIVFTGSYSRQLRESILNRDVLEYVIKETASSLDYALRLISFVYYNRNSALLIVDDSRTARLHLMMSLRRLPLELIEADSGQRALELMKENRHIKMVITDKFMPGLDGIELLEKLRLDHALNDLAIIGVSGGEGHDVTLEFLKAGANDFIKKPISSEELFTRVVSNIEMLDYIRLAKDSATRDYLTGLHNRRYLYDAGQQLYANARRRNLNVVAAMLDIDHFKKVNDTYGHEAGDLAIVTLADILTANLRESDIVARYGGEEFCIMLSGSTLADAREVMEKIRKLVEQKVISYKEITFGMTISIGLNDQLEESMDAMINGADEALYRAKEQGRNRVITSEPA